MASNALNILKCIFFKKFTNPLKFRSRIFPISNFEVEFNLARLSTKVLKFIFWDTLKFLIVSSYMDMKSFFLEKNDGEK